MDDQRLLAALEDAILTTEGHVSNQIIFLRTRRPGPDEAPGALRVLGRLEGTLDMLSAHRVIVLQRMH
jgi:hypothetical protein